MANVIWRYEIGIINKEVRGRLEKESTTRCSSFVWEFRMRLVHLLGDAPGPAAHRLHRRVYALRARPSLSAEQSPRLDRELPFVAPISTSGVSFSTEPVAGARPVLLRGRATPIHTTQQAAGMTQR